MHQHQAIFIYIGLLGLSWSANLWAFGGCVDSPENPTLILALLGGVAAGVPRLRRWLKAHKAPHAEVSATPSVHGD